MKKTSKISKIGILVGIFAALSGMTYKTIAWHYDTFQQTSAAASYEAVSSKLIKDQFLELKILSQTQYLELIISQEELQIRLIEEKIDAKLVLTSKQERTYETLKSSVAEHSKKRNKLIGLPEL